jgi:hypothetical protein
VHEYTLTVFDSCGLSGDDTVSATIITTIPPIALASATPDFGEQSATFLLDGSQSYDPDGTIASYSWDLSGAILSASVSAEDTQLSTGDYTYTLTVFDNEGLSASDDVTVHINGIYSPSGTGTASTSTRSTCLNVGETVDVILDGSDSESPAGGGSIVWFEWELSAFSVPNVSADIISSTDEISATVLGVSADDYDIGLTVSADNGLIDVTSFTLELDQKPTASAGDDFTSQLACDESFEIVSFSGDSDTGDAGYAWWFNNFTVVQYGQSASREFGVGVHEVGLQTYTTAVGGELICESDIDTLTVTITSADMNIDFFTFNPAIINSSSATVNTTLSWGITSAVSAAIDNGVGFLETSAVSAGSLLVSGTDDLTYTISAYDSDECIKTATAFVSINLGIVSACIIKRGYITLFGPDEVRYGECRDIDLVGMLPEYLLDTDTEALTSVYQEYLNEMYAGNCGYTIGTSAIEITACDTSSCAISAVDDTYEHITYLSGSLSANVLNTPADEVEKWFIDNACERPRDSISVLEKTYRLTELFDPDLIPIELIQFYASNLGYEVGLSRENVGFDISVSGNSADELTNQKRYLRFMVRNLPTWYKIKTTRNAVKMMLYSFGLVGDFIYYFTKNYRDNETGIGIDSLEYGGQDVNNYGGRNRTSNLGTVAGVAGVNGLSTDTMTYEEVQALKCDAKEWEEFKKNKKAYFEMLKSLQAGAKDDWLLTQVNPVSSKEDISNIPDDYFSSPHFRLWFDLLESLESGNFSTDIEKQKLISEAILAIKPINTVFEGVTGVFQTLTTIYMQPYVRLRKHITLVSDGYADYWYEAP